MQHDEQTKPKKTAGVTFECPVFGIWKCRAGCSDHENVGEDTDPETAKREAFEKADATGCPRCADVTVGEVTDS